MIDAALECSEFIFFEQKNFFGYHWGTTFGCNVTFVRSIDIFSIPKFKWIRRILGWYGYHCGTQKMLCCKIGNKSLQMPYHTSNYGIFARFYLFLKFDVFARFQSVIKSHILDSLKSRKIIKLQNTMKTCKDSIIRCVIWHLKAFISNFATQHFLGTTMVPILS